MGDLTETVTPLAVITTVAPTPTPPSRTLPIREDCWSEEATSTLVDAWGNRYLELNRGNLRQKDWQEVANAVNALHAHSKKTHRTDVQCKNRIDTIKKKYKVEKARVLGGLRSSWPFFERMDGLIGSSFTGSGGGSAGKNKQVVSPSVSPSPPVAVPLPYRRSMNVNYSPVSLTPPLQVVAAGAAVVGLPQKRSRSNDDNNYFRRNYSAVAAAAAATESDSDEEEEEEEEEEEKEVVGRGGEDDAEEEKEGMRVLAGAIERFGEVYQRVESQKLKQMVGLEKQRMKFAKDLEMERMRIFTETQIQLVKIRRGSASGATSGNRTNGERGY